MIQSRIYSTSPASVTMELSGAPQGFSFNYFKLIRILVCSTAIGFFAVLGIIETSLSIHAFTSTHAAQPLVATRLIP